MTMRLYQLLLRLYPASFRDEYGEERFTLLGMSDGRLLLVAYTLHDDRIRIISARGAEPYEHRIYHEEGA